MRPTSVLVCAATLFCATPGCSRQSAAHPPEDATKANPEDDREAILATILKMNEAFGKGDIETVMSTYEPGAVVVGQPGSPMTGNATLRAMFGGFVDAKAKFTFGTHEVLQSGDTALHITDWKMEGIGPDGQPVSGKGLSLAVLRRQEDGSWLMVIDDPYGDAILPR